MSGESNVPKKNYKFPYERRQDKRIEIMEELSSFRLNNQLVEKSLVIKNISKSGVYFETTAILQEGDVIEIYISIPGSTSVPLVLNVVWRGYKDNGFSYGGGSLRSMSYTGIY